MLHETAAISAQVLCTPYNHAPCHFMQSHIRKVYACLAVTCHLHFWQNDRDLLHAATAVTRRWIGYRNKSQHRKSTLEKKILPPLQQGFEPATFQSRVRRSNHWAIPAPDVTELGYSGPWGTIDGTAMMTELQWWLTNCQWQRTLSEDPHWKCPGIGQGWDWSIVGAGGGGGRSTTQ